MSSPALAASEPEPENERRVKRIALRLAIAAAIVVGLLPPQWLSGNHDARVVWAAELGFFIVGALILRRRRTDFAARRNAMLFFAVALWLVAPYAGVGGTLLLRLPMMQIAALMAVQHRWIAREATRFPATIRRPMR